MKPVALFYLSLLPALRTAARDCGYALALHGSVERDLDLIAVPWTDDAKSAEELVAALGKAAEGWVYTGAAIAAGEDADPLQYPTVKPHGRRAWCIGFDHGAYIDLSVTPRASHDIVL